jgi:hypothetical protein
MATSFYRFRILRSSLSGLHALITWVRFADFASCDHRCPVFMHSLLGFVSPISRLAIIVIWSSCTHYLSSSENYSDGSDHAPHRQLFSWDWTQPRLHDCSFRRLGRLTPGWTPRKMGTGSRPHPGLMGKTRETPGREPVLIFLFRGQSTRKRLYAPRGAIAWGIGNPGVVSTTTPSGPAGPDRLPRGGSVPEATNHGPRSL